jgi:hypothetical protein
MPELKSMNISTPKTRHAQTFLMELAVVVRS